MSDVNEKTVNILCLRQDGFDRAAGTCYNYIHQNGAVILKELMCMYLQRINENKIKCTLSREELEDRDFTTVELEKRSDRMWELFREVIHQAEEELDFRADESPLKIEVMLNTEEMTLIITKDTGKEAKNPIADNIAALVNSLTQHQKGMQVIPNPPKPQAPKRKKPVKKSGPASAVFVFESMSDAIRAAANISPVFRDRSVLYRDKKENQYLLCLTQVSEDATVFAECCLMLVEFGKERDADSSTLAYMDEHYEKILPEAAVETLSTL